MLPSLGQLRLDDMPTDGGKRTLDPEVVLSRQKVRDARIFGKGTWNADELNALYRSSEQEAGYRKLLFQHLLTLRDLLPDPATNPGAMFARVDTAAGAEPNAVNLDFPSQKLTEADYEPALQTLVPVVRYMYEYKRTLLAAKKKKLGMRLEGEDIMFLTKALAMIQNASTDHNTADKPLLVRPQPKFLPLRVAAPPRKGKSAYALLVASIAMRLNIRVLYSVAPNKRIPISEMMNKIRTLDWERYGVLQYSIDDLMEEFAILKTDICNCTYDQFNILFYSKDTPLSDVERIGALLDSWLLRKDACVLHIHDEAQALAKNSQQGEECHVERPPPAILGWLRRYYSNIYGLVLLVTATHLPVLQESALFGYTGSTSQQFAVAPVGSFQFDPEAPGTGDLSMDRKYRTAAQELPEMPKALVPPPTPTYYGAEYLSAWTPSGGSAQHVEVGKLEPHTIGTAFATPSYDTIMGHYREWLGAKPFDLVPYNVAAAKTDTPLKSGTKVVRQVAKPIYLACPTREVTTLTGQRQWMANFFAEAHARTVREGASRRKKLGDSLQDYQQNWWSDKWQQFRNDFGVAFFNFGSTGARDKMQTNLNVVKEDLKDNNLHDNARLGVPPSREQDQRILVYIYDPTHHLNVMDPTLTPYVFVYGFDDVKTAMRAIRQGLHAGKTDTGGYSIDKFAIIGYTMLTAGATIQDTTPVEIVGGQALKTYYVPQYAIVALTSESPLDEQLQLVGRTFTELHDARFPADYKIKLLSVLGESERLTAYAHIERYYAEADSTKIYKLLKSVYRLATSMNQSNPTRSLGTDTSVLNAMMSSLMGKRRGMMGDIFGLPQYRNTSVDPNAVGGFGSSSWGGEGSNVWSLSQGSRSYRPGGRASTPSPVPPPSPLAPGGPLGWLRSVWRD